MQDQRDGAVAVVFVVITGLQATAGAIDNKFGHQSFSGLEWGMAGASASPRLLSVQILVA